MIEARILTEAEHPRGDATEPAPGRRIRVAQVVTKLSAGAGAITLRGALALDPDRYSSVILTGEGGTLIEEAEEAGVEVVRIRHLAPERRVYPWDDLHGFREIASHLARRDFDVVHTHSAKAGGIGRLAARRVGVPAVVHSFHGFPFHDFQSAPVRRGLLEIERRLARITDYFLTDGTVVAADAVRLKLSPPERVRAIASPIDVRVGVVSDAARRSARRLLGIPVDAKVVGTLARLEGQKAPLDMVKAIAALDRPDLYMVWVGDGHLRSKTQDLLERSGLRERFLLLGNRKDVPELLPAFDVFVMSSLYEGLPVAIVEAMSCGIPVVATAVNSVPEIVISGKTGLLARPADPRSLARALQYLLEHPSQAARMAEAARAQIDDRFRPEALGNDLMEAYTLALGFASVRASNRRPAPAR